jgi:predicted dehydrogenase
VTYRAGVIGCGRKGLTIDDERKCPINYCHGPAAHTTALEALPEVDLVAIADIDAGQRALARERHAGVAAFESYEEMLSVSDLDLVVVATQTPNHAAATIAAARAGVSAIICEKAIATSMAESAAMIDACAASGAVLLVNHPRRYHPTFAAVEAAVASGRIGKLQAMSGTVRNGLIHNGSHFFDLFRLFGGEAIAVRGWVADSADTDGSGFAQVEFEGGVVGTLDARSQIEVGFTLLGTDGRIDIDGILPGYEITEYVQPAHNRGPEEWFLGSECKSKHVASVRVDVDEATNLALYRDALSAIENGTTPRSAGVDGAQALDMALGAFASHRENGATVPLPLRDVELRVPSR